jgi:hypothetical protein
MINDLDVREISNSVADNLRVRVAWHSVDLTPQDVEDTVNFMVEVLSKYTDNTNILNKQYNPQTDKVEVIG